MIVDREVTLKKKDGSLVEVSTSSHKFYDAQGTFQGVEGTFRDITPRKRSGDCPQVSGRSDHDCRGRTQAAVRRIEKD